MGCGTVAHLGDGHPDSRSAPFERGPPIGTRRTQNVGERTDAEDRRERIEIPG
jgi:hypothetical protein